MKAPKNPKGDGKSTMERPQHREKGASGVNKKVAKASVPQVVATTKYGKPTARQKM